MNPVDMMRPDLVALEEYPAPSIEEIERQVGRTVIRLDKNENPYGTSPRVLEALARADVVHYPDAQCSELRRHLSEYLGVPMERIVCSAGGDEMLDLLLRLFLEPGDEIVDLTPSFVMYELSALYNRGRVIQVPRAERFAVDVAGVEQALTPRTKVIFLCNPNNPTGNPATRDEIVRLLETGRIVVLDEAYSEFYGHSDVDLVERYPNLIVMRTMSKWAALAGLRLGYAVVHPSVVPQMAKIKSPYNVGVAAQVAGVAALRDQQHLMGNVRKIVAEREVLYARLTALPFGLAYPSETNFLYWMTGGILAPDFREALLRRGVLVRAFRQPVEALRFSVGTPENSAVLVDALIAAHAECAG